MTDLPPRLFRSLPAAFIALILAACAAQPSPPTPSPTVVIDPPTAAFPPAVAAPTGMPPLAIPVDRPSPYHGPLPGGAVARLGQGILNLVETSPDGSLAAVGTSTGVLVYRTANADLLWSQPTLFGVTRIQWSPDGSSLTAYGGQLNSATFYPTTERGFHTYDFGGPSDPLTPPPPYRFAITGADHTWLGGLDSSSGALTTVFLTGSTAIDGLAWSPDGTRLAVGTTVDSTPNHVVIWDVKTGQAAQALGPAGPGSPMAVGWSPAGNLLSISYDNHVHLFDTSSWAEVDPSSTPGQFTGIDAVSTFAWAPDGDRIAIGGKAVWSFAQGRALYPITGADLPPAWSGDGRVLVTSGGTGELVAWDGVTGQKLKTLADSGPYVVSMALNPDGSQLAETSFGYRSDACGRVNIWSVAAAKVEWSLTTRDLPPFGCPRQIAWSPDGKTLAVAFSDKGAGGIAIFDAQSGVRLKVLRGHASFVSALAYSPDSKLLASSSGDGTVILWDMTR